MISELDREAESMEAATQPMTQLEQQTLDTFNRHVAAFQSANVQSVLNNFAEDAIVITPDGVFEGKDRIGAFYSGPLAEFGRIDGRNSRGVLVDTIHLRDDTLLVTWHTESLHHTFLFGTDTFLINDTRINRRTVAFSPPQPKQ
jgi:hypothetical protein